MSTSVHGSYTSRIPEISRKLPLAFDIATLEAAHAIEEIAKALCPVGTGRVHLRDRIHVERTKEGDRELTWVVAGDREAWYGHLVEHGSVHHTVHAGEWIITPHPFLTPAAEAGREIARERANRAIKEAAA
jgi:HK97 gp10 family phage protein